MRTILEIKTDVDTLIRQKVLPGSITKTNHSDIEDDILDEIRDRGVIQVASTSQLDDYSHNNTLLILVQQVGFFVAEQTPDPADDDTTFESADAGWLWRKILDAAAGNGVDRFTLTADGTYTLVDGYQINQINIKPSEVQTQKAGLTPGGEEIMEETELVADRTRPIQMLIVAEGADKTLYFTGITESTAFTIYKNKL